MNQAIRRALAILLAVSILHLHPVSACAAERDAPAGKAGGDSIIVLDFKSAGKIAVARLLADEHGVAKINAAVFESGGPAAVTAAVQGTTAATAPPVDGPKTSRRQRIVAFIALAAVGAATAALAVHEARQKNPKLIPGTPARVSP